MPSRFLFKGFAIGASGQVTSPFNDVIEVQAASALPETGGYGSARIVDFRYRDLFRFDLAHTEVSGMEADCCDDGPSYSTLLQSTVEGLDIGGMVRIDRIVTRVWSNHKKDDPEGEPSVRLIGAQFENLQVAGIPIKVGMATDVLDRYPTYTALRDAYRTDDDVRKLFGDADLKKKFNEAPLSVSRWFRHTPGDYPEMPAIAGFTSVSLVRKLEPESPGLDICGHVIQVPGFGTIRLAEARISRLTRAVSMLQVCQDCPHKAMFIVVGAEDGGSPW